MSTHECSICYNVTCKDHCPVCGAFVRFDGQVYNLNLKPMKRAYGAVSIGSPTRRMKFKTELCDARS